LSDIFREVEEEVRRERLERIWKDYGDYIVAAVALIILAAAAFRLWTVYEARERAKASAAYIAAQQLLENGQSRPAAQDFARISQTAPGGYAKLSQIAAADALSASGDKAKALSMYRKLIDGGDDMLSNVARVRAAWILVEGAPKSEVESVLAGLAAPGSAWHSVTAEILAYADFRAGDRARALQEFQKLANGSQVPEGVRRRSEAMVTYLTAGGDRNVGKPLYPANPVSPATSPQNAGEHTAGTAQNTTAGGSPKSTTSTHANGSPRITIDTNLPQSPTGQPAAVNARGPSPK
jgi:hypothetical protein